jgi:hypothetical protein
MKRVLVVRPSKRGDANGTIQRWASRLVAGDRSGCLNCRRPLVKFTAVWEPSTVRMWRHSCGTDFSEPFLREQYGIDLSEVPAGVIEIDLRVRRT